MPDEEQKISGKTSEDVAASPGDRPDHVPYAQMAKEEKTEKAPNIDSHSAGGQGLSG